MKSETKEYMDRYGLVPEPEVMAAAEYLESIGLKFMSDFNLMTAIDRAADNMIARQYVREMKP
jgi:hypothetical protein